MSFCLGLTSGFPKVHMVMRTWEKLLSGEETQETFLTINGKDVKISNLERRLAFLFLGLTHCLDFLATQGREHRHP